MEAGEGGYCGREKRLKNRRARRHCGDFGDCGAGSRAGAMVGGEVWSVWRMWFMVLAAGMAVSSSAVAQTTTTSLEPTVFDSAFNILYGSTTQIEQTFDGRAVSLSMTQLSGSGFQSKDPFLFGQLSLKIKLVPGDSAGVVTCFYLHSMSEDHDEFDFEFLGNKSGEPVVLQTNIYANGVGGREERISLWFDPAENFHTYTVLWNHNQVVFYVDSIPIRALKNTAASRSFFPRSRPMWVFSSI